MENADDRIMDTCFRLYDASVEGVGIDGIIDRLDAKSSIDNVAVTVEESYEEIEEDKTYSDREDNSFIKERSIFDSYEDDGNIFDEDDEPTLFERIREMLQNRLKREDKKSFSIFKSTPKPEKIRSIKKNNKSKWGRKKEVEISEDFEEDFQYDPNQQIYEPTVLLRSFDESSDDISRSGGLLGELEYIGDSKKDNIKIDKDIFLLGSAKEGNDSVIDSPVVSRFHAKIIREGRSYYIEDLNSTNGTTVNGELIGYQDKVELKSDDVVMFADERYKVI